MGIAEIIGTKRESVLEIASKYGAYNVRVIGSVARGDATDASDVDFLVGFEKGRTLLDMSNLILDLEELLGRPVEVATDNGLDRYVRENVLRDAVLL
jgi:hypothetical protein